MPTVAPSSIRDKLYNVDIPHELTDKEICDIIEHFVQAAERAKKAGFDGVQLHLAHGFLLSSFLSPHMNKRKDQWGGSIENRFRIIHEILVRTRKSVGDYPILAKINGYEISRDGLKITEAVTIAKYLEETGCDAIEVSCGIAEEGFVFARGEFPFDVLLKYNDKMKNIPKAIFPIVKPVLKRVFSSPQPRSLYNVDSAAEIKKNVKIPVIVVGGIRKVEEIDSIIEK
jgi:2,4-dienoyl-CoA reductase-like NADH-dependent reductase (Old Yellow Enzyme family)